MFGKNEGTTNKNNNINPDSINRIVAGTIIKGDIESDSIIRIDGRLEGSIKTKNKLVVGETGIIDGDVICENADIFGTIKGQINVSELLSLKSTAKLTGDIISNKLAIEPGAQFSGSCSMGAVIKDIKHGDKSQQKEKSVTDNQPMVPFSQ